ncbi:MAG TPA: hypothetical protein VMR70_19225 [Flavisolibacter sp.]|nr:hypothetical protein [Flavisolibacter sp.]
MDSLFQGDRKRTADAKERFLTVPVIILLLLMISFVGAGFYVAINTFSQ